MSANSAPTAGRSWAATPSATPGVDPSRFESNPKRRIDDVSVFLGDREIPVARVIGSVLELVASEACRQLGALPDEMRITHPARWAAADAGPALPDSREAAHPVRLPPALQERLRKHATAWTPVPPLPEADAEQLVRRSAPGLGPAAVRELLHRGAGRPLALRALAAGAAQAADATSTGSERGAGDVPATAPENDRTGVGRAVATAVAALSRPARTAIAALGLLGRPAPTTLLGPGITELAATGWFQVDDASPTATATASPPYVAEVAEVAAALLPPAERAALHRRLVNLLDDGEAVRHLGAAGDNTAAYPRALAAADTATTTGARAAHLIFAAGLDVDVPTAVRLRAAEAALAAGRPAGCLRIFDGLSPAAAGKRVRAAVLRSEALLQAGNPAVALDRAAASGDLHPSLASGLRSVTARWAAHDLGTTAPDPPGPGALPPVRATLAAWRAVDAGQDTVRAFGAAARAWQGSALREEVRCLLAAGLTSRDPGQGLAALLDAERVAEDAGLVVLLGRIHRALRRFAVRREAIGRPAAEPELTAREREVLHLVAAGEPTRRIAGQLGISREAVETHVRAGMRKLGARTRTEAATLVLT